MYLFSLYLSCQRKLDIPYDWVGGLRPLRSDMQHSVQNRAGDVWCPVGQGAQGQIYNLCICGCHAPPPGPPASPGDPLPLYIAKLRQRKSMCMSRFAGGKRQIETCTQGIWRGVER